MTKVLAAVAIALAVVAIRPAPAQAYHSGGQHWGSFKWGGVQQSPVRYVYVFDRTSDGNSSAALRQYINAMQSLWRSYPALPYLIWVDQRAHAGACPTGAGWYPGNSMIMVCNGTPGGGGRAGYSWWKWDGGNHFVGEADVWLAPGWSQGDSYTIVCHEMGHVIGFTGGSGHSNNPRSCMYAQVPGPNIGYDSNDLAELVNLYYSHYPS